MDQDGGDDFHDECHQEPAIQNPLAKLFEHEGPPLTKKKRQNRLTEAAEIALTALTASSYQRKDGYSLRYD